MNPSRLGVWFRISFSLLLISSAHAAGPLLQVLSVTRDRQVTLRLTGSGAAAYALERSTDLTHWSEFLTVLATNQPAVVEFSADASRSTMFFRAREVAPVLTLAVTPHPATNDSVRALLTPEGGSVELSRYDGTRIVLSVPAGAVVTPQLISMTLVTNFTGLPFAAPSFGAVRLEPEGLRVSGALQIFYPAGLDRRRVVSFHTDNDGANFRLVLDRARSNHVVIPHIEFGTYGSTLATTQEVAVASEYRAVYGLPLAGLPSARDSRIQTAVAPHGSRPCLIGIERIGHATRICFEDRMLEALSIGCGLTRGLEDAQAAMISERNRQRQDQMAGSSDDPPAYSDATDRMCAFYSHNIAPLWPHAKDNCTLGLVLRDFVFGFERQLQLLGFENIACLPDTGETLDMACASVPACMKEIKECCERGQKGPGGLAQLLALAHPFQFYGYDCFDPFGPETREARIACLTNAWIGSFKVSQIEERLTNWVDTSGGSHSSSLTFKKLFEGMVFYSEEEIVPEVGTNLILHVFGSASTEYHREFKDVYRILCTPPTPNLQSVHTLTHDFASTTNGAYIISISIDALFGPGQYMLSAVSPTIFSVVQTDREVDHRPACNGRHLHDDTATKVEGVPVTLPTLIPPETGILSDPDHLTGTRDISLNHATRLHVEWDFRRNKDPQP